MTIRTKTIYYAFPTNLSTLASNTRYDFSSMTLYIPETTSRTFKGVQITINCRDSQASAANVTAWLMGIKLGATAFDDSTKTSTITQTGDHASFCFSRDVTSYFASNFGSGSSQTCQVGFTCTGRAMINITAMLSITYEYDDAATTRIKSIMYPLESYGGTLTTSYQNIGGSAAIPALDTELPEASKVYRDVFFIVKATEAYSGTTDYAINMRIDTGSPHTTGLYEEALNSSTPVQHIWKAITAGTVDFTTNATHDISMSTSTGSAFNDPCVVMVVTYEYDHSSSSTIYNSVQMVVPVETPAIGGSTSAGFNRNQLKYFIEEPATIAVKRSAILINYSDTGAISGLNIRAGISGYTQGSYTNYANAKGSVHGGHQSLMHRFDSDGSMVVARGENTVNVDTYRTSSGSGSIGYMCGMLFYLNYTSGKHASGDGVHNHTVVHTIVGVEVATAEYSASKSVNIPETNYYLNNAGYWAVGITSANGTAFSIATQNLTGSGDAQGRTRQGAGMWRMSGEINWTELYIAARAFKRYPSDPAAGRVNISEARNHYLVVTGTTQAGFTLIATYHAITTAFNDTITGYTGDGSGITVNVHRADTLEYLGSATTVAGGGFSFTWYDDVADVFAHAWQDATHAGRNAVTNL